MLKSEWPIFDEIKQVEEGVMRASRLMRLGWRSQKEDAKAKNNKQRLIPTPFYEMLKLPLTRNCTSSSTLCFSHIARYAPETAEPNLTHICDSDFNISYWMGSKPIPYCQAEGRVEKTMDFRSHQRIHIGFAFYFQRRKRNKAIGGIQ